MVLRLLLQLARLLLPAFFWAPLTPVLMLRKVTTLWTSPDSGISLQLEKGGFLSQGSAGCPQWAEPPPHEYLISSRAFWFVFWSVQLFFLVWLRLVVCGLPRN